MLEQWRPVPSFNGYLVSNLGQVRRDVLGAPMLKGSIDKDGYRRVCLYGCTVRVHVIVAETFHGMRPEGLECAHLDGNCSNNAASNLAWVTHQENVGHQIAHGTLFASGAARGQDHPKAKLTAEQVEAIRSTSGIPTRALAAQYGVNQSQIVRIKNGTRWAV